MTDVSSDGDDGGVEEVISGQPDDRSGAEWAGFPGVAVEGYPGLRAGVPGGHGLLRLARYDPSVAPGSAADPGQGFKYCPPTPARIMQGNRSNIGRAGGWGPSHPVTGFGTAVDTVQWGGKGALRPYIDQISGTLTDGTPLFEGVSEVVGGHGEKIGGRYYDAAHVRQGIKDHYPGQLVLEIPNQNDMGTKSVVLRVPKALSCPKP